MIFGSPPPPTEIKDPTPTGLVNVDFADVRAIMANAGSSLMGIGTAAELQQKQMVDDLGLHDK
ncbi:hypothetical protein QQ045_000208 [Rhodiola kirilowii]